jgi:ribosome-associated protein
MSTALPVNDLVTLPAGDLRWTAMRASGPGGQNVNKVSSKVELRFDLLGTQAIDGATKDRMRGLSGVRLGPEGELIILSQKTRDQAKNLEDAREKLCDLVRRALVRPTVRRATRPSRARVRARLNDKRKQSEKKATRRTSVE